MCRSTVVGKHCSRVAGNWSTDLPVALPPGLPYPLKHSFLVKTYLGYTYWLKTSTAPGLVTGLHKPVLLMLITSILSVSIQNIHLSVGCVLCPAAFGSTPPDRGVDLRHGREGQPTEQCRSIQRSLPVLFTAHLCQVAVPGWLFWPWHCGNWSAEERERAAASLPGMALITGWRIPRIASVWTICEMIGIICYLIDLHLNVFTGYLAC